MKLTVTKTGDLSGVAKKLERAARESQRVAGKQVAAEGRKFILDDVRRSRPQGLRMMGARLSVKTTVDATAVSSVVELRATPAGPWAIVVSGTRAYDIRPRRREVLAVGKGDVIGMHAHRRRQPGHDYWTQATERLDTELGPLVERIFDSGMGV